MSAPGNWTNSTILNPTIPVRIPTKKPVTDPLTTLETIFPGELNLDLLPMDINRSRRIKLSTSKSLERRNAEIGLIAWAGVDHGLYTYDISIKSQHPGSISQIKPNDIRVRTREGTYSNNHIVNPVVIDLSAYIDDSDLVSTAKFMEDMR